MLYENGVDWYTKGIATVPVYYPSGNADCRHCSFIGTNKTLDIAYCKFTGEYIERNMLNKRGAQCPVVFEETTF